MAFGIIALLRVELIVNVGSNTVFAMVFVLLLSATSLVEKKERYPASGWSP